MTISDGTTTIELALPEAHQHLLELEQRHRIAVDGIAQPSVAFLRDIASYVRRAGLSITLSAAWQLWRTIFILIEQARRDHAINADLSHWFGVHPSELTDDQRAGLYANLHRVHAQTLLNLGNYSPTDYTSVYNLTLAATGSKAQAEAAQAIALRRFVESEVRKGNRNA